MSDGNRSKRIAAIAAAGLIGLVVASIAIGSGALRETEYNRDAYERGEEYTTNTYNPERDTCLRLPSLDQRNCIAKADHSARENERGEQDLVAQKVTALWTSIMGGAAVLGMVLSAVGVFLVWTTFSATKEGNKIARETGEAQARAYLAVKKVEVTYKHPLPGIHLLLTIKNTGPSPAYNLVLIRHIRSLLRESDSADHRGKYGFYPLAKMFAAGQEDTFRIFMPECDEIVRADAPKLDVIALLIEGLVEYQTVFGVERVKVERDCTFAGILKEDRKIRLLVRKSSPVELLPQAKPEWISRFGAEMAKLETKGGRLGGYNPDTIGINIKEKSKDKQSSG